MSTQNKKNKKNPRRRRRVGRNQSTDQKQNQKSSKSSAPAPRKFNVVRLGRRIGNLIGPKAGLVGAEAGRLFRQITGYGDYKVNRNSLLSSSDKLPAFGNLHSGTRIRHREYLFDVITAPVAGEFKLQSIMIQPALLASFPWLSASAENYQEYQLNGIIYEFKSNSYDALSSTNTASGTVVMATNYNVLEPDYPSKFFMEQSQFACSAKPSQNLIHPIECAKLETPSSTLYTRSGPVTEGDARLYDWANFQIATVGMQGSSTNIGELWVSYDITLLKPKLGSTVDVYDHYILNPPNVATGGPGYFGLVATPPTLTSDSDMGTTLSASDTLAYDTIHWPAGYTGNVMITYFCDYKSTAVSALATPYSITYGGGASALRALGDYKRSTTQGIGPLLYNGTGGANFTFLVKVVNGGYVRLTGGTTAGAAITADLLIVALPSNFEASSLSSSLLTHSKRYLKPSKPYSEESEFTLVRYSDLRHGPIETKSRSIK